MAYYFIYSISFLGVWSLLLLDHSAPELPKLLIGLVYTFYSSFIIRFFVKQETQKLIFIKFIGPLFFLVLFFNAQTFSLITFIYTFISPISIAFLLFCIAVFSKENFPKKEVQFFVISFIFLYSLSLHGIWNQAMLQEIKSQQSIHSNSYDFELKEEQFSIPNLSHYQFLNSNFDSITLNEANEYTIIETWNEKCAPCFKAMEDFTDFYKKIKPKSSQFYVYIPTKKNLDYTKIFSFDKIEDKSSILVDINLQQDARLKGYPIFLVFNKAGKLVYQKIGYNVNWKNKMQEEILNALTL